MNPIPDKKRPLKCEHFNWMAQPFVDQPPPSLPPRKLLARSLNRHLPACTGWLWGSLLLGRASSNLHERLAGPCLLTLACVLAASGSRRVCTEGGRASAACIHSLRSRGWGCACCAAIKSRNKPCMAGSRPAGQKLYIQQRYNKLTWYISAAPFPRMASHSRQAVCPASAPGAVTAGPASAAPARGCHWQVDWCQGEHLQLWAMSLLRRSCQERTDRSKGVRGKGYKSGLSSAGRSTKL